ncbi:unnamed protein product [Sphenostylis stenocarpa]|uniref:Uncharacterized protein n=1 Tax=Sphenostylis stenocarpa TaxID=92480 RepID=A0AA86SFW0_9FABA|nr:unnamed protein product [Sphenostylis stenocarpa]
MDDLELDDDKYKVPADLLKNKAAPHEEQDDTAADVIPRCKEYSEGYECGIVRQLCKRSLFFSGVTSSNLPPSFAATVKQIRNWLEEETAASSKSMEKATPKELESKVPPKDMHKEDKH